MKIFVKARAGAKEERVEKIDDTHFVVAVKEPPKQGRANGAIAQALLSYFHIIDGMGNLLYILASTFTGGYRDQSTSNHTAGRERLAVFQGINARYRLD